jgi:hypothetical protein
MPQIPWIIRIYESIDDLRTLWRMFCIVASIPVPMN